MKKLIVLVALLLSGCDNIGFVDGNYHIYGVYPGGVYEHGLDMFESAATCAKRIEFLDDIKMTKIADYTCHMRHR